MNQEHQCLRAEERKIEFSLPLPFGFVGAHPCDGIEFGKMKIHSSVQHQSMETEKESVSDDECVRETHSLLREVHQAIFYEQVE